MCNTDISCISIYTFSFSCPPSIVIDAADLWRNPRASALCRTYVHRDRARERGNENCGSWMRAASIMRSHVTKQHAASHEVVLGRSSGVPVDLFRNGFLSLAVHEQNSQNAAEMHSRDTSILGYILEVAKKKNPPYGTFEFLSRSANWITLGILIVRNVRAYTCPISLIRK